jgi:hypothetical protein
LVNDTLAQVVAHITHEELLEVCLALAIFHIGEEVSHHNKLSDTCGHPFSFDREVILALDGNLYF